MPKQALMIGMLLTISLLLASVPSDANEYVELPVLAAITHNNLGAFEIMLMGGTENPIPILFNCRSFSAACGTGKPTWDP